MIKKQYKRRRELKQGFGVETCTIMLSRGPNRSAWSGRKDWLIIYGGAVNP